MASLISNLKVRTFTNYIQLLFYLGVLLFFMEHIWKKNASRIGCMEH